jgi:hypothetical protein
MSERDFQAAKYRLTSNSRNINTFQTAMDMSRIYCLSSSQARELANFLANDRDKFDFLKASYANISDKENFTDVMDVFRLFSSAIRLYHQTLGAATITMPQSISSNPNCPRAMNPNSFNQLRNQVFGAADDRSKASTILNAGGQCMTSQQIGQLITSIQDENIRFDVLKRLFPYAYDGENYPQVSNNLSSALRSQFLAFLQNPTTTSPSNPSQSAEPQTMTEIDFNNFLNTIRKQSFEKDKDQQIRTYMKNAFMTTTQIKQVIKLLTYDSSRLDIAKFLFNRCVDKQNYFEIANELQFSSSKTELNDYVKSRL